MSLFRSLSATLLSALVSFSIVTASGCGTSAVGIDDCRDIERARCQAGKACGLVDDVAACERYVHGHCLHGLATSPPPSASVDACVTVIEAAGECAKADPETPLDECAGSATPAFRLNTACDVVLHPERAAECEFLTDLPPVEGAGGEGSTDEPDDGQAGASSESGQGGTPAE